MRGEAREKDNEHWVGRGRGVVHLVVQYTALCFLPAKTTHEGFLNLFCRSSINTPPHPGVNYC